MIFEHTSYRAYLKAVLAERVSQNPNYSLRSFARQLELSPSILSQAMNSRRNLSVRMAFQVAQNLRLPPTENEYFCLLAQFEVEKLPALRDSILVRLNKFRTDAIGGNSGVPRDLSVEMFKLISDWYHIPIIEMTELKRFKFNPENVAKRLRITKNEAEVAIDRLVRLGLIETTAKGTHRKTNLNYDFRSPFMNDALNKFHKQMLAKASDAVSEQAREERQIISNTFSIDVRLLPKAAELVAKFRQELVQLFDSSSENTETYHLGLQLFRLTELNKTPRL